HDQAVAADEEEASDNCEPNEFPLRHEQALATESEVAKENQAGENEADAAENSRRKDFDGDTDGEVGCAPREIDGGETEHEGPGRRPMRRNEAGGWIHPFMVPSESSAGRRISILGHR